MFLDMSGLLCLLHMDEPRHKEANGSYVEARQCVTQSYVLAEFVALGRAACEERMFWVLPAILLPHHASKSCGLSRPCINRRKNYSKPGSTSPILCATPCAS